MGEIRDEIELNGAETNEPQKGGYRRDHVGGKWPENGRAASKIEKKKKKKRP
ncbi:hypothetical protein Pmar_PMAR010619, partial [Perkinsus marinus ATCC 50983]